MGVSPLLRHEGSHTASSDVCSHHQESPLHTIGTGSFHSILYVCNNSGEYTARTENRTIFTATDTSDFLDGRRKIHDDAGEIPTKQDADPQGTGSRTERPV